MKKLEECTIDELRAEMRKRNEELNKPTKTGELKENLYYVDDFDTDEYYITETQFKNLIKKLSKLKPRFKVGTKLMYIPNGDYWSDGKDLEIYTDSRVKNIKKIKGTGSPKQ